MKYIIKESQLKNFIKKALKIDLDDKMFMITSAYQLPPGFLRMIGRSNVNHYLNNYGPMYLFKTNEGFYLAQKNLLNSDTRELDWAIADKTDVSITEFELMKLLGIQSMGVTLDDLVKEISEEDTY